MDIVGGEGFAFGEAFLVSEDGRQSMVLSDVVPVEAAFLEHGHSDLMMFEEVAQLVIFVVVDLAGEVGHVEGDASKDVAVQLACQAATGWMKGFCCSGGRGCGMVWDCGWGWWGGGRVG